MGLYRVVQWHLGMLEPSSWRPVWIASGIGTLGGMCLGYAMWWPSDPISGSWVPFMVPVCTIIAMVVSFGVTLLGQTVSVSGTAYRRSAWLVLLLSAAFGPASLAMTPPLVARRMARNERVALERFDSLKLALERTASTGNGPNGRCDGFSLRKNYFGPAFSDEEWRRITGKSGFPGIARDGYEFTVFCQEEEWLSSESYTLEVRPIRPRGNGSRRFCTDESRKVGCEVKDNGFRRQCQPCPNYAEMWRAMGGSSSHVPWLMERMLNSR